MTIKQRKKMIEDMKEYKNSIMICTQQSLSSSISINYVNKIIISENGWNSATLKQFYARFIRFDSESDNKEIHFVNYENSIDINLTLLNLTKERFNSFMQNEEIDDNELNNRFGVNFDIMINMLITKEFDAVSGKSYLKWGQQKIV